ncbi:hypothetical protein [Sporosarcina sp. A2]|uniref:hypothetical protein n=1 Tax=Sporosarcina sp. A2 TaxID=3393449 RepID=UPI003D78B8FF
MRKLAIIFSLMIIIWSIPLEKKVRACSCVELPPVSVAKEEADAVFLGTIRDIVDEDTQRIVTINVREAWKGVETETIKVYTGFNSGDCGLPIEIGGSYLFYANDFSEGEEPGFLTSTICTRTTTEMNAANDLKELGEGKKEFIQSEPSSSSNNYNVWLFPSIGGVIVVLFILSWIIRKKRN